VASRALSRGEVTTDLTDLTGGYFPVVSVVPCSCQSCPAVETGTSGACARACARYAGIGVG
jgi:hypothetical protein